MKKHKNMLLLLFVSFFTGGLMAQHTQEAPAVKKVKPVKNTLMFNA